MKVEKQKVPRQPQNGEMDPVQPVMPVIRTLFSRKPQAAFAEMQELVQLMAQRCTGPEFIAQIGAHQYPKVEWWTTLGATLALFPVTVYSRKLDRRDEITYEARVEVRHGETVVAAGEALCSNQEKQWASAPEYCIKSMAITRATGKAYRIPLSFLAVMAGLAPTNAEEIPPEGEPFREVPKASVKQLDFLLYLAQQHYDEEEAYRRLEHHIQVKYGVSCGQELSRRQASELIDYLMSGGELLPVEDR